MLNEKLICKKNRFFVKWPEQGKKTQRIKGEKGKISKAPEGKTHQNRPIPHRQKKRKGKKKISKKKMAPNVVETGVLKTSLDNIVSVGCARLKPRGEGFRGKTCDIMCEDDVFFFNVW